MRATMTRRSLPRAAAAACLLLLLAPPAAASAARLHLALRRAEPAVNGTVATPPRVLRLWFTQPPELAVTAVRLVAPGGAAVQTGPLARADSAGAPVVVPVVGASAAGAYRVEWRTMAKDGHVQRGQYAFTVRAR